MAEDERDDCVPFFATIRRQIVFEFMYLFATLAASAGAVALTRYFSLQGYVDRATSTLIYAALGGFLGGWTVTLKWL